LDAITSTSCGKDAYVVREVRGALAYPHGRVQRTSSFMVLLDAWTTSQNLRNVELVDCSFGVSYFSAAGNGRCLCPIVRLFGQSWISANKTPLGNTKNSIGIAKSPRRLDRRHFKTRGKRLDNPRVQT